MRKCIVGLLSVIVTLIAAHSAMAQNENNDAVFGNASSMIQQGREIFRFDTYGDEAFWGDRLKLHQAIAGQQLGGVGNGLSPTAALDLGLKVDVDALPTAVRQGLQANTVNLNDPATTVALLRANAVVGVKGIFNEQGQLNSIGITCALCHSTVDDSLAQGIGHRLDGWANRDLNVGAIIALAPDLSAFVDVLKAAPGNDQISQTEIRRILNAWGPGKFDAELILDGKGFRPDGQTAATLIPNAFDMAGFNLHTWTGAWGSVPYWNAFVAVVEMHGVGNFFDPRLDTTSQFPEIAPRFPVAVANQLGHITVDEDKDQVTKKLAPLHMFQIALPAPKPQSGKDFNADAAERGDELFGGKAKCATCHVEDLWTEPGWNAHRPEEIGIDSFQADRSPDKVYKTMNLSGLFIKENGIFMKGANKGRFYHDGRFKTLLDVVNHYNSTLNLSLTDQEKQDLVEYLKSL